MIELKWLLTAGFELHSQNYKILIDPYISRPKNAIPQLNTTIADIKGAQAIFLSHGHFDHAFDLPEILKETETKLYCSKQARKMLIEEFKVSENNIQAVNAGDSLEFEPDFKVKVIKSKHIRFNASLILKKIFKGDIFKVKKLTGLSSRELLKWKKGDVFGYLFQFNDGRKLLHFGSGGYIKEEIAKLPNDIDYFLAPVAGRTNSDECLARLAGLFNPKTIIPHHYDDFFPPISWNAYGNFDDEVKKINPDIKVMKIEPEKMIKL
ncbi:MAG: MBL fold metallo-hydrolase [Promethearchaeota archaeon]